MKVLTENFKKSIEKSLIEGIKEVFALPSKKLKLKENYFSGLTFEELKKKRSDFIYKYQYLKKNEMTDELRSKLLNLFISRAIKGKTFGIRKEACKTIYYIGCGYETWKNFNYEKAYETLKKGVGNYYDLAIKNWPEGLTGAKATMDIIKKNAVKLPEKKLKLEGSLFELMKEVKTKKFFSRIRTLEKAAEKADDIEKFIKEGQFPRETETYYRFRIKDPDDFDVTSFRTLKTKSGNARVVGKINGKWNIQSILINKKNLTKEEIDKYLDLFLGGNQ